MRSIQISTPRVLGFFCCLVLAALTSFLQAENATFSLVFLSIIALPLLARGENDQFDLFRPYLGLALLIYLYSASTLLYVTEFGVTYYQEAIQESDLNTYRIACLLTAAGLAVGAALSPDKAVVHAHQADTDSVHKRKLLFAAGLLAIICAPFIATKFLPWTATNYADVALELRVEKLQDQAAGLKEVLLELIPLALILCALTWISCDKSTKPLLRIPAAILLILHLATMMLSGWRSSFMIALLIIAIFIHYRVKKIQAKIVIPTAILIYVLINLISVARVSANPAEMISAVAQDIDARGFAFLALQQSGELATSTNLLRLIQGIRLGESDYGYGSIALGQIQAFLPRALAPNRPEIASELFVKTFYPGIFESGGGYGFFLPQDGYWDFGLAGVFFYALALSILVERGYHWLKARFYSGLYIFLYGLLYSQLVLSVVRSGFFASLKAAMIAALPLLLLLAVIQASKQKSIHAGTPKSK